MGIDKGQEEIESLVDEVINMPDRDFYEFFNVLCEKHTKIGGLKEKRDIKKCTDWLYDVLVEIYHNEVEKEKIENKHRQGIDYLELFEDSLEYDDILEKVYIVNDEKLVKDFASYIKTNDKDIPPDCINCVEVACGALERIEEVNRYTHYDFGEGTVWDDIRATHAESIEKEYDKLFRQAIGYLSEYFHDVVPDYEKEKALLKNEKKHKKKEKGAR
ncbi:hypothetical protein M2150_001688 [Lachnospiraceae bacterium PM6-15]|uniref:hypothetical protein n=1 Tax=Ohessyouella blattaphilus TaxID=2949333 RepID=UPI003E2360C4